MGNNDHIAKAVCVRVQFNAVINADVVIWVRADQLDRNVEKLFIVSQVEADNIQVGDIGHILHEGTLETIDLI